MEPTNEVVVLLVALQKQVEDLRVEIRELREEKVSKIRDRSHQRILSQREAAKRLRISRESTLQYLIADKKIKTIMVNGKEKIPATEVERLSREGFCTNRS